MAVTDPKIADVQALTPEQVLIQGLKVGSTDLILWSEDEQKTWQRRVVVRLDANTIRSSVRGMFPTAVLDVNESGEILLVRGTVRSADQALQLTEYLEKTKTPYVNMTTLSGVQQVQLQVRVAEVSRAAVKALGINAFYAGSDAFFLGQRVGSSTGGAIVPSINIGAAGDQSVVGPMTFVTPDGGIGTSPLVTIFAGFPRANLEFFFQALAENQYMRILANPTLVALSGEEATFLAGGEFPIPVVQGSAGATSTAITIQYKEFGVRLIFRPIVLGDARHPAAGHAGGQPTDGRGCPDNPGLLDSRPRHATRGSDPGAQERPVLRDGRSAPAAPIPRSTPAFRAWAICRSWGRCFAPCATATARRSS